jgi:hypothetical protein
MQAILEAILEKYAATGLHIRPRPLPGWIPYFENMSGLKLPQDFRAFYAVCDGFTWEEDGFQIFSLWDMAYESLADGYSGDNWVYFSEYMTYCDMWGFRVDGQGGYSIFNGSYPEPLLSYSLTEFLERFLAGGVFETGGLYDWLEEKKRAGGT